MSKRIGIFLYQSNKEKMFPNVQMLIDSAEAMGYKVDAIHITELAWKIERGKTKVLWKGKKLPQFDFIIGRYRLSGEMPMLEPLARVIQDDGQKVFNRVEAATVAKNKAVAQMVLASKGIPMPKAAVVYGSEQLATVLKGIRTPVVVKTIFGSLGIGVFLAESMKSLRSIIDFIYYRQFRDPVIVQEMVRQDKPTDIRALVVGDKVVAAMQRSATKNEFRSNLGRDGVGSTIKLTKKQEQIAVMATKAINLDYAGVDLIVGKNRKTYVIEVNSNPGLSGITEVTGVDVATLIIKHCAKMAGAQKRK